MKSLKKYMRLTVSLALIILISLLLDWRLLVSKLAEVNLLYIIIALCIELAFYVIESKRIQILLNNIYSFKQVFRSRLLSVFLGNFLPGTLSSEVLRVFILNSFNSGKKIMIASTLLLNRIYGLLALCFLFSISLGFTKTLGSFYFGNIRVVFFLIIFFPLSFTFRPLRKLISNRIRSFSYTFRSKLLGLYFVLKRSSAFYFWIRLLLSSVVTATLAVLQFSSLGAAVGIYESFLFGVLYFLLQL